MKFPMRISIIGLLFASAIAMADTPPLSKVTSKTYDGAGTTPITSTAVGPKNALDMFLANPVSSPALMSTVYSGSVIDPRAIRALTSADQVSCVQSGSWNVGLTGTVPLPTGAATESTLSVLNGKVQTTVNGIKVDIGGVTLSGTVNSKTQDGSGTSITSTTVSSKQALDVNVAQSALPAGAATESTLSALNAKVTASGSGVRVDGSAVVQPISASSLPLPAGAATSANQTSEISQLTSINSKTLTAGQKTSANSYPVVLASDQSAIPVSVTGSGIATESTLSTLNSKFGTLGQKLMAGSAPVTIASDQSAIPSSQSGFWDIRNITGTQTLPTGASTESTLSGFSSIFKAFDLDTSGGTENNIGVSLRLSAPGGSVEAGTATNPLRIDPTGTTIQPVSGTVISRIQDSSGNSITSTASGPQRGLDVNVINSGTNTADQGTPNTIANAWPVKPTDGTNSQAYTASGAAKVDGSAVTQPISATSLPLPAGAATEATLSTASTTLSTINSKLTTTPSGLKVDGSSVIQPVSGTVSAVQSGAWNVGQSGTWTMNQGVANTLTGAWPFEITDGTNVPAVKGASTAPLATDPALVVSLSPNAPITVTSVPPTNGHLLGNLTAACATGVSCGAGSTVQITTDGNANVGYTTYGTWSGTITTDISYDSDCATTGTAATWFNVGSFDVEDSDATFLDTWTETRNTDPWVMNVSAAQCARVRAVSLSSGTVNVHMTTGVGTAAVWSLAVGNVASGSTDEGNPIKAGGKYNATLPTFSDGNRGDLQIDSRGRLITRPLVNTTDSVNSVQSGTWNVGLNSGSNTIGKIDQGTGGASAWLVTGTGGVFPSSQSGAWTVTANAGTGTFLVDGSAHTQPVSGSGNFTVVQPTGTNLHTVVDSGSISSVQSGAWSVGLNSGSNTIGKVDQGAAGATAWKVDGSAVTQPVSGSLGRLWTLSNATDSVNVGNFPATQPISGTVTANIGTTNGLALDATVSGLQVAQGSTTSGEKGALTLGAVTTAAPTYTTAQSSPLSLTTAGALRVDGSGVTQPVSGSMGRTWTLSNATDSVNSVQSGTWTTARSWTLASGTDSVAAVQSGTWNINNISGTVSLPTGAATAANQTTANTTLSTIASNQTNGTQQVQGNVASGSTDSGNPQKVGGKYNSTAPSFTNGQRGDLQIDADGTLYVNFRTKYQYISTATTTTIKTGVGKLMSICVGTTQNGSIVTSYDNTSGTGTVISLITSTNGAAPFCQQFYGAQFNTGLTVVTTGTQSVTVVYQ